jgi:hypothetical protein
LHSSTRNALFSDIADPSPEILVLHRTARTVLVVALLVTASASASQAQAWGPYCGVADTTVHRLPVTREEDQDGAWSVWYRYCRGGFYYHMTPAELVPGDPQFKPVDVVREGDIIWWPWYMAVMVDQRGPVQTRDGQQPLSDFVIWFGEPKYYVLAHKLSAPDAKRPDLAVTVPVWKAGDPKVNALGLTLGASRAAIAAALGAPDDSTFANGTWTLQFPNRDINVQFSARSGVTMIQLGRTSKVDILGVHAGSAREDVLASWGAPQVVKGFAATYVFDGWMAVMTLDALKEHVQTISIRDGPAAR